MGVLFTPVVLLFSWGAPTTTESPEIATDQPNSSPDWKVPKAAGFRYACCVHTPALRTKT